MRNRRRSAAVKHATKCNRTAQGPGPGSALKSALGVLLGTWLRVPQSTPQALFGDTLAGWPLGSPVDGDWDRKTTVVAVQFVSSIHGISGRHRNCKEEPHRQRNPTDIVPIPSSSPPFGLPSQDSSWAAWANESAEQSRSRLPCCVIEWIVSEVAVTESVLLDRRKIFTSAESSESFSGFDLLVWDVYLVRPPQKT